MNTNVKSMFVKINGISDIQAFVKEASYVEGDIEVRKGRWCIDAKSLMGMFSIDCSTGVTVVYPADAVEFQNYLKQYED